MIGNSDESLAGEPPAAAAAAHPPEVDDLLQRAFHQGADYALQQHAEQQAAEQRAKLEAQARANADQEHALRARIEALKKQGYEAPTVPMLCKEERQTTLACYRAVRGAPAGELVAKCAASVEALEKCAALVRDAAFANIAKETLKSS